MSYVIHVWERPVPTTVHDAAAIHSELASRTAPVSQKLVALANRLTVQLGNSEDSEAVWPEGPPVAPGSSAVLSIPVPPSSQPVVGPVLLQAARELGLVVFDEQAGQVHLPDGRLLALRGPASTIPTQESSDWPPTKKQVQAICLQSLEPVMSAAGFKTIQRQGTMIRKMSQATAQVVLNVTDSGSRFEIDFLSSIRPVWPEPWSALALAHGTDACLVDVAALARSTGVEKPGTPGSGVGATTVSNEAELRALMDCWSVMMTHAFLPLCNRCEDLEGLEREFNMQDSVFRPMPVGLMLAAAVGREGLDDLAQLYAQRVPNWFKAKLASLCAALGERGVMR